MDERKSPPLDQEAGFLLDRHYEQSNPSSLDHHGLLRRPRAGH
jgi:hypothetical protein